MFHVKNRTKSLSSSQYLSISHELQLLNTQDYSKSIQNVPNNMRQEPSPQVVSEEPRKVAKLETSDTQETVLEPPTQMSPGTQSSHPKMSENVKAEAPRSVHNLTIPLPRHPNLSLNTQFLICSRDHVIVQADVDLHITNEVSKPGTTFFMTNIV